MNVEEAYELMNQPYASIAHENGIMKGLILLSGILPDKNLDAEIHAEHDILYAVDFEETVEKMTEEQIKQMISWGWRESEDSWAHFC